MSGAPMLEFLNWVARCPRSYAEAMDAWRSSCPRYTVWEDALAADLILIRIGIDSLDAAHVELSPRGREMLSEIVGAVVVV